MAKAKYENYTENLLRKHGLFAVPLNNGDFMVGKANYAYSLNVGSDHYADENLAIAETLMEAIELWARHNKPKRRSNYNESSNP